MQYRFYERPDCPIGCPIDRLLLAGEQNILYLLGFSHVRPQKHWVYAENSFADVCQQLTEYFKGARKQFSVKYQLQGTAFQQKVLQNVAAIKYGHTASYSEIASKINHPQAARAVGAANANNCLPIIIPCHRVIGKNGKLTGFAGGIAVKQFLLELEQC